MPWREFRTLAGKRIWIRKKETRLRDMAGTKPDLSLKAFETRKMVSDGLPRSSMTAYDRRRSFADSRDAGTR
jgi:hypothetical protein